jgi:hypothetical protein
MAVSYANVLAGLLWSLSFQKKYINMNRYKSSLTSAPNSQYCKSLQTNP